MPDKNTVVWVIRDEPFEVERLSATCPMCGAAGAIVALPPPLRKVQPDGTTHVCSPFFGGCNHGFADINPTTIH
jgi:hypothetical protein